MQHAQLTLAHIKIGDRNGIVYCRSRVKAHVKANELTLRFELNVKCKYSWDSTWKNFIGIVIAVVCVWFIHHTVWISNFNFIKRRDTKSSWSQWMYSQARTAINGEKKIRLFLSHLVRPKPSCVCACVLFLPFSLNLFSSILGDYHNFSLYS